MKTTIHTCEEYDITIDVGCSTASDLPEGGRSCSCFQGRIRKSEERKKEILSKKKLPNICGNHPTEILIQLKNTIASKERREQNKQNIIPIIQKVLGMSKIGKGHEIHYKNATKIEGNTIGIQLYRNFDSFKDDPRRGNTTPAK